MNCFGTTYQEHRRFQVILEETNMKIVHKSFEKSWHL